MSPVQQQEVPVEVFYSYSHRDEKLRNRLDSHLALLQRQGFIKQWYNRKIEAGEDWEIEINEHLDRAQIILLLISDDFIASDYCYSIEMERALERHRNGEARVIPILLRPVDWESSPFGLLQALPQDAKPVTSWRNRDEAFKNISQGVRRIIKELHDLNAPGTSVSDGSKSRTAPPGGNNAAARALETTGKSSRLLRVFLCHSSNDKSVVRRLYKQLRADGFDPWLDEEDIVAGKDWDKEITRAVHESDVVVICLSQNSITKSGYVQKEIKQALDVADLQPEGTIYLIPLRIEECEVPERLSRWHWVNLFEENGYRRLRRALHIRASSLGLSAEAQGAKEQIRTSPGTLKELDASYKAPAETPTAPGRGPDAPAPVGQRRRTFKVNPKVLFAVLGAVVMLTTAYWLFVYRPAHSISKEIVNFSGRVIDENTKQVIKGAKISIESQGTLEVRYTDSEGFFFTEVPSSAVIHIRVEADDYEVFDRNISVHSSMSEEVRLKHNPPPPAPEDAPSKSSPAPTSNQAHTGGKVTNKSANKTPAAKPKPAPQSNNNCTAEDILLGKCPGV